ncbi:MAG: ribonuclease E/G, partial [Microcoleus sp. SIO2G3]|nr:ribonuclease E/G [Microcoleus sp. SIO2G3]
HVLEHFNKALKADKARPQIAQLTELGLVELTRKRQGQNIYELFGKLCPTCGGLGHTVHLPGETESRPLAPTELPERLVSSAPHREPRLPVARSVEPRETYEGYGEAYETDNDLSASGLVNHPSYQEIGDSRKRRTRRSTRVERVNGGNGKDEPRIVANSLAFLNEPDLEMDDDAELGAPSEVPPPSISKPSWGDRAERGKVTKVELVKPVVEPPEIVTVEMSPEEQDVYAQMGVSPLEKLGREVRNPKSVIINVTLPGHNPAPPTESTLESPVSERASAVVTVVEPPSAPSEPEPEPATDPHDLGMMTDESEASSSSSDKRRRRRRSSSVE